MGPQITAKSRICFFRPSQYVVGNFWYSFWFPFKPTEKKAPYKNLSACIPFLFPFPFVRTRKRFLGCSGRVVEEHPENFERYIERSRESWDARPSESRSAQCWATRRLTHLRPPAALRGFPDPANQRASAFSTLGKVLPKPLEFSAAREA